MDIHHIRYFLAVCETRNFTRAAEKCQCHPAGAEPRHPAARGRGRRPAVSPRAQPHPHDRSRRAAAAALSADPRRTDRSVARKPRNSYAEGRQPEGRRHVHDRPAPVHRPAGRFQRAVIRASSCNWWRACRRSCRSCSNPAKSTSPSWRQAKNFRSASTSRRSIASASCSLSRRPQARPALMPSRSARSTARTICDASIANTGTICPKFAAELGVALNISYTSEREDWIQNMVAGGLGICFLPEYSAVVPGLQVRAGSRSRSMARSLPGDRLRPSLLTSRGDLRGRGKVLRLGRSCDAQDPPAWRPEVRDPSIRRATHSATPACHVRVSAIACGYRIQKHVAFLFGNGIAQSPCMARTNLPPGSNKENCTCL